jgi:hypothetical protein
LESARKRLVQNKFNHKSKRIHHIVALSLEIEAAVSPETEGVLITPWIGITSPFLFLLALVKHQHLFPRVERMNFPYLPLVKFHSLTPLLYMFPLHFLLSKNRLEALSKAYTL